MCLAETKDVEQHGDRGILGRVVGLPEEPWDTKLELIVGH